MQGHSPYLGKIVDLRREDVEHIEQIARFLCECFRQYSPDWLPDLAASKKRVVGSLAPGRRSRVLVDDAGNASGWIGAILDENVWEIHPIAVAPRAQRRGYGRALVDDICGLARASGAAAVWAGTGDETGTTSFSKMDLYRDAAGALASFEAPADHPVHFWLKMGFSLVGVMPDEEGLGKPGIHFAKRLEGLV